MTGWMRASCPTYCARGCCGRCITENTDYGRLRELARTYQTLSQDLNRVMNRIKALYRGWGIASGGTQVYAPRFREEWVGKIEHTGVVGGPSCSIDSGWRAGLAANTASRVIGGEPETQSLETAASDSLHRSDSGSPLARVDANPTPVPQQATTVDLQWVGHRDAG